MNKYFDEAITRIEREYSQVWTTEGLELVLSDAMRLGHRLMKDKVRLKCIKDPVVYWGLAGLPPEAESFINRFGADPKGWLPELHPNQAGIEEGAQWYHDLGRMLGAGSVATIMTYHQIRDNVQEAQKAKGISAIAGKDKDILFGHEIEYPSLGNMQLYVMPEDLAEIRKGAKSTFDLICQVLPQKLNAYDLSMDMATPQSEFVKDSGEIKVATNEQWEPCEIDNLLRLKDRVVLCRFYAECSGWIEVDGGWQSAACDRDPGVDPDDIKIVVGLDDLIVGSGDAVRYVDFLLESKDDFRFPWRGKE